MDRNRILELAVEELNRQKAAIDAEIETIRAELEGSRPAVAERGGGKRRAKTPAERLAQSQKMREYWASRRNKQSKPKKTAAPRASRKVRGSKARSEAMRAAWAKRKAQAENKTTQPGKK